MFSECAGFAREPAKLADQVRFLARTLQAEGLRLEEDDLSPPVKASSLAPTLKPHGVAAACKTAPSGFDSHRRLSRPTVGSDYITKMSRPNHFLVGRVIKQPNCQSGLHRNYDDPKVANLG
jgi:hypothetical protein